MAQTIKLKRSATQNAVPSTSQLELGEVAINTYDGKMYIKKNDGSDSIVEIGGDATSSSGLDFTGNLNLEDNVRIVIGDGNDLQIYHDGSNSIIQESGTGDLKIQAQNLRLQDNDGTNFLYGVYNGRVELFHNNSKKFETTSSGISVTGDISLSGNIVDSDESEIISIAQNDIIFNGKHIQSAYGVWVRGENTNSNNRKAGIDSDSQALSLKFYTDSTEHIRIDSSGRLLVNTTSSVDNFAKIQVVGDSSSVARITLKDVDGTNQYTYFEQSGGGTRINTQNGTSNGFFTIGGWNGTTSVDLLRVTGDGRVGIGTNAPAKELHIASSQPDILLQDTDGTNQTSEITSSGGNLFLGSRNDTANGLIIFRGLGGGTGDEYARFNSNGKLGIGITSPEHPLHVSFSGDDGAQIKSTDNHSSLYINAGSGYGSYIRFEENNASKYWINAATDGSLRFRPAGGSSNWVVFDSTGQVGIGTTSPSRQLHVLKSGTTSAIMIEAGDGNQSSIDLKNTEGWFRLINDGGSLSVYDQSDSAERFRINTSGNVGIGTNSPGRRLTVQGDAGDNLPLRVVAGSGTSHGSMEFQDPNTTADYKVAIGSKGDAFYVQAGGSERVRIHSGGQLGIGVTNFTSALRGNGKQLIIGSCFVGTGAALVADDFARFGGAIYIHEDAGTNSANVTSLDNNGDRLVITGKGGTTANALDAPDGFYVGGTQFITSSRQITNVTSITATGAISTTGTASLGAINVGSSTSGNVFFKRPNANYIFADQSGGYLVFGTNGRSTSIANSNFYLGTNQDVHFQGSITVASNVTSSGSFTSSQNQQGFRHIAPDVMSGHTSRNEMTFSWTADETRWYMFPTVDGSSNFGRELSFDYSSEEWSIEGPVTLSSLSTTASTTSSFAGPLTVGGTTLGNAFEFQVNGDARITNFLEAGSAQLGNTTLTGFLRGPSTFTIDPATHGDDTGTVVIAGNLQVDGTTTTINSTTLTVDDKNITLASGAANAAAASGAGITVDTAGAQLTYDATQDRWNMNKGLELIGTPLVVGTGTTDVGRVENSAGVFSLTAYTARQIAFGNDTNGEHVRIDANGNVGIGTTNPSEKLDIESAGSVNLEMNNTGNSVSLKLGAQSTAARLTAGPGDRLGLGAGNTVDYMTIASDGKVGIGTTSPGSKLSIHSALDDYSTTNPSATNSTLELRDTRAVAAGNGASIVLTGIYTSGGAHLGNAPYIKAYKVNSTDGNYSFGLKFATRQNGTSSQAVAMTIDDEQRVGIGTTSPARQIHVKDTNYSVARLERDGAGGGVALEFKNGDGNIWQVSNDGDEVLRFYYATNNRFQVTSTGAATFNNAFTFPTSDGSANQVLKTDGSGNVTWATEAAVSANTSISDADGNTKIQVEESSDENSIRFDTAGTQRMRILSNGLVAIGNGADVPTEKLHVFDNINNSNNLQSTGTSTRGAIIKIENDNTTAGAWAGLDLRTNTGDARIAAVSTSSSDNDADLAFIVDDKSAGAGVERLRIKGDTGNVGIGTTSPGEKLHVSGGNIKVATTDIPAKILLDDSRATAASEISQRSDGRLSLAAVAGSYGTTGIEILSNGNVGIRTTTPYAGAKMQICADDTSPSLNTTAIDDCTLILSNSDDDYGTVFATDGTGKGYIQQRRMAVATYYDLSIQPYGGNVGIGTASPSRKFEIHENTTNLTIGEKSGYTPSTYGPVFETNADALVLPQYAYLKGSQAYIRNESNLMRIHGDSGIKFSYYNGSATTEGMRLDNSGRLGIGTTSPSRKLDISAAGNDGIRIASANALIGGGASGGDAQLIYWNGSNVYYGRNSLGGSVSQHEFRTGGATRLTIASSGRVGIGTASPDQKLHVEFSNTATSFSGGTGGAWGSEGIRIENTSSTSNTMAMLHFRNNDADIHVAGIRQGTDNSDLGFFFEGSEKVRFTNDGKVGIGTTSPSQKLSVNGNIYSIGGFVNASGYQLNGTYVVDSSRNLVNIGTVAASGIVNIGGGTSYFSEKLLVSGRTRIAGQLDISLGTGYGNYGKITHNDSVLKIETVRSAGSNGQIHLAPLGTTALALDTAGKVGIGTTTPSNQFVIKSGTGVDMEFGSEPTAAFIQTYNRTSSAYGHLRFVTNGETMRLTNTGNVGIGTTSPDAKLQVAYNGGHTSGNISLTHSTLDLYNPLEANTDEKGAILTFSDHYQDANGYPRTVRAAIKGGTDTVGNTADGFLAFYTDSGSANSATERMRITKDGNVGIGTASPSQKLHVVGGGQFTNSVTVGDSTSDALITTGVLKVGLSGGTTVIDSSRNLVNIGTLSSTANSVTTKLNQDLGSGFRGTQLDATNATLQLKGGTNTFNIAALNSGLAVWDMTNGSYRLNILNNGNVGIGTTSPQAKLQVEELGIETTTTSTTATTQVAIDTMAAATFRSAKYTIQVTNTTDSSYHVTEILLIHDGTTPGITEYGTVFTGSAAEATFDADISSGNVRLLATPASTDSMTFKVVRHCITV